jgi:hypothetical protein
MEFSTTIRRPAGWFHVITKNPPTTETVRPALAEAERPAKTNGHVRRRALARTRFRRRGEAAHPGADRRSLSSRRHRCRHAALARRHGRVASASSRRWARRCGSRQHQRAADDAAAQDGQHHVVVASARGGRAEVGCFLVATARVVECAPGRCVVAPGGSVLSTERVRRNSALARVRFRKLAATCGAHRLVCTELHPAACERAAPDDHAHPVQLSAPLEPDAAHSRGRRRAHHHPLPKRIAFRRSSHGRPRVELSASRSSARWSGLRHTARRRIDGQGCRRASRSSGAARAAEHFEDVVRLVGERLVDDDRGDGCDCGDRGGCGDDEARIDVTVRVRQSRGRPAPGAARARFASVTSTASGSRSAEPRVQAAERRETGKRK